MKRIVSMIAFSLAVTALPALAQTNNSPNVSTPSGQNSGAGVSGHPGNKNGPAAKAPSVEHISGSAKFHGAGWLNAGRARQQSGPPANKPPR
jgi:hypothetical protein